MNRLKQEIARRLLEFLWEQYRQEIYRWAIMQNEKFKQELIDVMSDENADKAKRKLLKAWNQWRQKK